MAAREVTVFLLCITVIGISAESCRSATVCCTPDFHQCKGECSCIIFSYKSIQRRVLHVEFFAGTHRILYDSEEMTIIDNGIFHPRRVDNGQTPSSSSQFKTTQAATTSEQGGTSEWVTPSASPRPLSTGQTFTREQGGTSESVITPSASPRPLSTGQTTTSEQSDTPYTVTPSASPLSTGQMLTSKQGGTSKLDTSSASPRPLSTEQMLTSEQGGTLKLVTPSASPRPLGTGQTTTSEQGDTPELVTPSASHSSTGQSYGTQTTHVFVNTSSLAYTKNSTEQIASIVLGVTLPIGLAFVIIFVVYRRRRHRSHHLIPADIPIVELVPHYIDEEEEEEEELIVEFDKLALGAAKRRSPRDPSDASPAVTRAQAKYKNL